MCGQARNGACIGGGGGTVHVNMRPGFRRLRQVTSRARSYGGLPRAGWGRAEHVLVHGPSCRGRLRVADSEPISEPISESRQISAASDHSTLSLAFQVAAIIVASSESSGGTAGPGGRRQRGDPAYGESEAQPPGRSQG